MCKQWANYSFISPVMMTENTDLKEYKKQQSYFHEPCTPTLPSQEWKETEKQMKAVSILEVYKSLLKASCCLAQFCFGFKDDTYQHKLYKTLLHAAVTRKYD